MSHKTTVDAVAYVENFNEGVFLSLAYGGNLHFVFSVCDVTIWRHIHVSKLTFWRSLLTWYAYSSILHDIHDMHISSHILLHAHLIYMSWHWIYTINSPGWISEEINSNDFIISDYALLPQDTFTYISDAHNTTSWIDHFVSSFSVHQGMLNMDVLTECIISDHRAVAVSIQCSHLPEFDDEVMESQTSRIDWLKVTAHEREDYYHKSKSLHDQLQVPTEVRHCQKVNCTDEKHLEEIVCRADQCSACCKILYN